MKNAKINAINLKECISKHIAFLSILLIIFTWYNIVTKTNQYFQTDSESFVADRMLAQIYDIDIGSDLYGLGKITDEEGTWIYQTILENDPDLTNSKYVYTPYESQVGLQGMIFGSVASLIKNKLTIPAIRWVCAMLFVIIAFFIARQMYKLYGMLFAIAFWVTVVFSTWLINFGPNLYWVMFTWFVPMLLGLLCITHEKKRIFIYPLFFLSIFIKCMCGYEYISTVMVSGEVFLLTEFVLHKEKRGSLLRCMVISGVCMLAGFAAVVIIQSMIYGNGDLIEGLKYFKHFLVDRRTFGNPEEFDTSFYNEHNFAESLNSSVFTVLKMYFWDIGYGRNMLWLLLSAWTCVAIEKIVFKKECRMQASLLILQMLSTISWLVLAKAHSYIHTHINFVLFDMGYTQICIFCLLSIIFNHIKFSFDKGDRRNIKTMSIKIFFV